MQDDLGSNLSTFTTAVNDGEWLFLEEMQVGCIRLTIASQSLTTGPLPPQAHLWDSQGAASAQQSY